MHFLLGCRAVILAQKKAMHFLLGCRAVILAQKKAIAEGDIAALLLLLLFVLTDCYQRNADQ